MKKLLLFPFFLLFLSSSAFANPVAVPSVFDLIQNKQNVCVVLMELHTSLLHRLTRTSQGEETPILDNYKFEPGSGVDGTDIFVVTDRCVPEGEASYLLEEKREDGWHMREIGELFVGDSGEPCDEEYLCDGSIDPEDYAPDEDAQDQDDDWGDEEKNSGDDDGFFCGQ